MVSVPLAEHFTISDMLKLERNVVILGLEFSVCFHIMLIKTAAHLEH